MKVSGVTNWYQLNGEVWSKISKGPKPLAYGIMDVKNETKIYTYCGNLIISNYWL